MISMSIQEIKIDENNLNITIDENKNLWLLAIPSGQRE